MFPLRFFSEKPKFNFMKARYAGFGLSLLLIIATFVLLFTRGMSLGIDFTGGILIEVRSEKSLALADMREILKQGEYGEVSLQYLGGSDADKDVLIRIQSSEGDEQAKVVEQVKNTLSKKFEAIEYRKIDYVGPTVGRELVQSGYLSLSIAFAVVLLYIWFRFEWQFGVGAVIALIHDAILTIGFYVITGFDFGLTSIAAILTIIGYSINDSVVIYDRIRENMRRFKKKPLIDVLNQSVNETLSRTVLTAGTTVLAAGALVLFGGEVIKGFSAALLFGVIIGTYSSVYIAAPILIYFNVRSLGESDDEDDESIEEGSTLKG